MNDTIKADVDARGTDCPCCGGSMDRKEGRLCDGCTTEGCDPSTELCLRTLGDA